MLIIQSRQDHDLPGYIVNADMKSLTTENPFFDCSTRVEDLVLKLYHKVLISYLYEVLAQTDAFTPEGWVLGCLSVSFISLLLQSYQELYIHMYCTSTAAVDSMLGVRIESDHVYTDPCQKIEDSGAFRTDFLPKKDFLRTTGARLPLTQQEIQIRMFIQNDIDVTCSTVRKLCYLQSQILMNAISFE